MYSVEVTISGELLRHLIYHFVLPFSNWEQVSIAYSENFEALSEGLQESLWTLGGVPVMHRTDNLSAATHELIRTRGRGFTERYLELLCHYGMNPSKNHSETRTKTGRGTIALSISEGSRPALASPRQSGVRDDRGLPKVSTGGGAREEPLSSRQVPGRTVASAAVANPTSGCFP